MACAGGTPASSAVAGDIAAFGPSRGGVGLIKDVDNSGAPNISNQMAMSGTNMSCIFIVVSSDSLPTH